MKKSMLILCLLMTGACAHLREPRTLISIGSIGTAMALDANITIHNSRYHGVGELNRLAAPIRRSPLLYGLAAGETIVVSLFADRVAHEAPKGILKHSWILITVGQTFVSYMAWRNNSEIHRRLEGRR